MKYSKRIAVSGILLAAAIFVIGFREVFAPLRSVDYWLVIGAAFLGMVGALLNAARVNLLVKEGAQTTIDYVQSMMAPTEFVAVNVGFGTQMMSKLMSGIKTGVTKNLGKAVVVVSKAAEFILKGIALLCALLMLLVKLAGLEVHMGFFLGLWVVVGALLMMLMTKFTALITFVTKLLRFTAPDVNFSEYSRRTKAMLLAVGAAMLAEWVLGAMQWWLLLTAFGHNVSIVAVFFMYALVSSLALVPLVFGGLGLMEIAGVLVFLAFGVPAAVSFLSLAIWEVIRLAWGGGVQAAWLRLEASQKIAKYK